jgi:adenosylmethionine-8-amino-7-oxononanoate aminotransferase
MMTDPVGFDAAHLWHPYAPSGSRSRLVESAHGVRLRLADEGNVVDGMSSWWSAIHGYRHPVLDAAVASQLGRMSHVMFGGLTHEPAVELGRRLLDVAPDGLDRVFFADSGSVAVEVALKMCLQYHRGLGRTGRTRMLTVRGGYYGDTLSPMSVCDPVGGMHAMWAGVLPEQLFAPRPPAGYNLGDDDPALTAWAAQVRDLAHRHRDQVAGIIVEPVLQGAGGMFVYSPACLRVLRAVADEVGAPLVLDEIATGFGRTGEYFAARHAGVAPDLMLVGKALTGGYLTLAAVLCSGPVAAAIDASESGALMHGPTFMANPLACAVAVANLDLLARDEWQVQVMAIESRLWQGLHRLIGDPGVADVRVLGAVGVVELDQPVEMAAATAAALAEGVWLRPFGRLIYTMPPYLCGEAEVTAIVRAVGAATAASVAATGGTTDRARELRPGLDGLGAGMTLGEAS